MLCAAVARAFCVCWVCFLRVCMCCSSSVAWKYISCLQQHKPWLPSSLVRAAAAAGAAAALAAWLMQANCVPPCISGCIYATFFPLHARRALLVVLLPCMHAVPGHTMSISCCWSSVYRLPRCARGCSLFQCRTVHDAIDGVRRGGRLQRLHCASPYLECCVCRGVQLPV